MAPQPYFLARRNAAANPLTWGIVAVVIVALAFLALVGYLAFGRRRNQEYLEALKRDPYLTRREFLRRRKMSPLQRIEEEELQRSIMIRKSLASRTGTQSTLGSCSRSGSGSSSRRRSQDTTSSSDTIMAMAMADSMDMPPLPLPPRRFRGPMSASVPSLALSWTSVQSGRDGKGFGAPLKDEWKEWEAGVRRERSNTGATHPGFEQVSLYGSIESIPLAHDRFMTSRTHLLKDPITAPQLPRLPTFLDLNEDWRQSTASQQLLQEELYLQLPAPKKPSRLAEFFSSGPFESRGPLSQLPQRLSARFSRQLASQRPRSHQQLPQQQQQPQQPRPKSFAQPQFRSEF